MIPAGDLCKNKVLVLDKETWEGYKGHLTKGAEKQAQLHKEQERIKYLKEGSQAMIAQWFDSDQNVVKRRKLGIKKPPTIVDYKDDDNKKKLEYIEKVEEILRREMAGPKSITRALVLSHTLHEREVQIALKNKTEEIKNKMAQEEVQKMREDVQKFHEEQAEAARKLREKNYALTMEHEERIIKNKALSDIQKSKKLEEDVNNRELANIEMKLIEEKEHAQRMENRKIFIQNVEYGLKMRKEKEEKEKRIDELENKYVFASACGLTRIQKMRKDKESTVREIRSNQRFENGLKAFKLVEDKETAEHEKIMRIIKERNDKEDEKEIRKRAEDAEFIAEKSRERDEFLKRKDQQRIELLEQDRWAMLNRFKHNEINKEFPIRRRKIQEAIMKRNRDIFQEQIDDKLKRKAQAELAEEEFNRQTINLSDNIFFNYANETIEECKRKGMPLYPLLKCVNDYKIQNNLISTTTSNEASSLNKIETKANTTFKTGIQSEKQCLKNPYH